ncbi:MAG: M28 family metallopeptidase [Rhodothermales bacterium]
MAFTHDVIARQHLGIADSAVVSLQKDMVARLTGYGAEMNASGIIVRSSPKERAKAADFLFSSWSALGLQPLRHAYRKANVNGLVDLILAPYKGTNIYTILEADRDEREYIVVGAHYDSEPGSPGAGDNAAGVALVYSLADRLAQVQDRRLNFIFVFFDQEEDDEVGSTAFAQFLEDEKFKVHSVHVTDLSGWDIDGDRVIELQSPGPMLLDLYQHAADRMGVELRITTGGSSDNKSFLKAGYHTAGVFGDITEHLHKSTDTLETVDFEYLNLMTALMFTVLADVSTDVVAGNE